MEKKQKEAPVELDIQQKINAEYLDGKVLAESSEASREFYEKSRYGEPLQKKFQYSLVEALYLLETMGIKKITLRGHLSFQHADHPIQSLSIKNHEEVDLEVNCYRLAPDVILDHYTEKAVKEKKPSSC